MEKLILCLVLFFSSFYANANNTPVSPFSLKSYRVNVLGRNILNYEFIIIENSVKITDIKLNRGHCKDWDILRYIGITLNYGDKIKASEFSCNEMFMEIEFFTEKHGSWVFR
nr:hypothetical protein BCU37_17960 [Vibrio splendidus]PMJ93904.1 hypothetical protein BCU10_09210 [Vibrio splendidus]PMK52648.1 hypothetical protein BCT96_23470 [Vibrio splendidus]